MNLAEKVAFAQDPKQWPLRTRLALVRYSGEADHSGILAELGFLVLGGGPAVVLGNVGEPLYEDTQYARYPSFEALFVDGWEID